MAHYRKIDPKIWNDEKFMDMSANGQLACLFIMTHPHMTAIGGIRATVAGLASEHYKLPEKAFKEAFQKGIAVADKKAPLVWLPNFLKYNPPESPNVVKAWVKAFDYIPECHTKTLIVQHVKDYLKGFSEAFQKAFSKDMPESRTGTGTGTGIEDTPLLEDVKKYFLENGYTESAATTAFKFYAANNWYDSKGNKVQSWKQKMITVWFKDKHKIPPEQKKQTNAEILA